MQSMTPGNCYRVTFFDSEQVEFRLVNVAADATWIIEEPIGSGNRHVYQQRFPGGYTGFEEISCPLIALIRKN